jgi:hypothetical protein
MGWLWLLRLDTHNTPWLSLPHLHVAVVVLTDSHSTLRMGLNYLVSRDPGPIYPPLLTRFPSLPSGSCSLTGLLLWTHQEGLRHLYWPELFLFPIFYALTSWFFANLGGTTSSKISQFLEIVRDSPVSVSFIRKPTNPEPIPLPISFIKLSHFGPLSICLNHQVPCIE